MLSENRIFRYVMYALGEVLLVVIGILIALHLPARETTAEQAGVNNWNEENKLEKSINDHLTILKKDLKKDQKILLELQ